MSTQTIGLLSFVFTLVCYFANKRLYRRYSRPWLMPLIATPAVLLLAAALGHISYKQYIAQTHWLIWLLGPATVAFALPLYENRALLRKHGLSISTGVVVASVVSICSSIWLAQLFDLPVTLQKGLAVRSVTTPFAIEAERVLGGSTDMASLFVLLTGVSGMFIGDLVLRLLPIVRSKLAIGALFGAGAHGSGVAKARQLGDVQVVVASLVMMISGAVNVMIAPWVKGVFF